MNKISKSYLIVFTTLFFALSTGGWGSSSDEDENDHDERRQQLALDVAYENYRWDLRSAQRGYIFYTTIKNTCNIIAVVCLGTGGILATVAAVTSGNEEGQDGSGWALASAITTAVGGGFKFFANEAGGAAKQRKKHLNRLTQQNDNEDEL